jgi:hypothetical protein
MLAKRVVERIGTVLQKIMLWVEAEKCNVALAISSKRHPRGRWGFACFRREEASGQWRFKEWPGRWPRR